MPLKTAVARAKQVVLVTMRLASSSLRMARTRKLVMSVATLRANAVCPRRNLPLSEQALQGDNAASRGVVWRALH